MMKIKKMLSLIIVVLIAMLAICGCSDKKETSSVKKYFTFTVVHKNGDTKSFDITTDKATVGEALKDQKLISGDEGAFGIYVKTVDGETLDYEKDGYWWALYKGDEQLMTGADKTAIEQGATYTFKAEKS